MQRLTKKEWLGQFDAAIKGVAPRPGADQGTQNIEVTISYGVANNVADIAFTAKAWSEEFRLWHHHS